PGAPGPPPVEHAARRFPLVRRPERVDPGERSGRADRGLARAPPQRALVDLELRRVPDLRLRKRTRHALRPRDGRGGLPARDAPGPRAARGAEAPAGLSRPPISAVTRTVVVVGAGVGGLTAALRLGPAGFRVRVLEARAEPGGLASGFVADGLPFDAGPYILLDRPGLEWAFRALGLELADHVELRRIEEVYEVGGADGARIAFHADLGRTAEGFETRWPGSGTRYATFVATAGRVYRRLEPLLHHSRPGAVDVLRTGAWRHLRFLLGSLGAVLARTGLPPPLVDAIAIWTHVARPRIDQAPSPMAFVPAIIHGAGAFYPVGGIAAVPRA